MYEYDMKYELCGKDYSEYVDILKFKGKNPNNVNRIPFTEDEINALTQIILMLIYIGVRVSGLLDFKLKNVHIAKHYFNVVESKINSDIRVVPIHEKIYPIFKN